MGITIRRRARSPEQKEERCDAILNAAQRLLASEDYDVLTMSRVAAEAGVAKGTLFLYYETKEALFLALLARELMAWFDVVDQRLDLAKGRLARDAFVQIACDSLQHRPALDRLLTLLETILERNISFETALSFKRKLRDRLLGTGSKLEARLRFLKPGGGARLILCLHAIMIGLMQQANPGPVMRRVHEQPDLRLFAIDFDTEFRALLQAFVKGLTRADATMPRRRP